MKQKPQEQTKSGVDISDVVMYPLQIVGAIVFILLLKRFTPFPIWACAIIGMPLFFAVFWGSLYPTYSLPVLAVRVGTR